MKESQFPDAGFTGQIDCPGIFGMPPCFVGFVFFRCVLGVMDEEISVGAKFQVVFISKPARMDEAEFRGVRDLIESKVRTLLARNDV